MISCRKASQLISESMDRPLRRRERLSLGWHLLVCKLCKRYRLQLLALRDALKTQASISGAAAEANPSLSPEARERIREAISRVV